ncbi:hypothetical protein FOCC_FOCC013735 [Frankliniella occidentalis]|nr:hypothetical protein FOCC_FOCC013735 [Frankliniella occidentalis]
MNFRSIQEIADRGIIGGLTPLPGAAGTRVSLISLQEIMNGFLDKSLTLTDRVYVVCRKIGCQSLINVIRLLRNMNKLELFRPWLMDSQACEKVPGPFLLLCALQLSI